MLHKIFSALILGVALAVGAGASAPVVVPALPPKAAPASPDAGQATQTQDTRTRAQALVRSFYAVQVEPLWNAFTPDMQQTWGSLDAFRAYREAGVREYGPEARVLKEEVMQRDGLTVYVRTAVFASHPQEAWSVVVGFDPTGRVALFTIVLEGGLPGEQTNQS